MQSFDMKKILPHIYILLGFIMLAVLFSYPQLQGMVLSQGDIISWKAMSKEAMDWHEKTGENVLWSNSTFGGMPTFTYYVPETNNYIYPIQKVIMGILGKPAGFLFLAMLGFYILSLTLGFNKWIRVLGSIAYAFATYNITLIEAGHETKLWALAYMPIVLSGLILLYRGKYWTGIPVLGISMALLMGTGHYQVMYYTIIIIVGMVITFFITALKEKNLKTFFIASAIAVVTAALGVLPNLQLFMSTVQYNKTTMRGGESELTINHDKDKEKGGGLDKEYAFGWSNAWGESFCVMIPYLYGGSNAESLGESSETYDVMTNLGVPPQQALGFAENLPTYWGPQPFTGGPFYFGAIICFLFLLAMFIVKSPHKWWILAVSLLAFLFSVGKHFPSLNYFLFDTLPALNRFRIPNMILLIPQLLFPLLGLLALNDIINEKIAKEELWKKVKLAGIITIGLCLVLGLGGSMFFDYKSFRDPGMEQQLTQSFNDAGAAQRVVGAIQEDRAAMSRNSALMSAFMIALAVGLLWAYYKDKLKALHVVFALIALVAIDLIRVDAHYLNEESYVAAEDYEDIFNPRPVDQQILKDPDPYYRVLDLSKDVYNDAIQAANHKCIGGYSPTKMEVYQDLIDIHIPRGRFNAQVLNMLNTKYIISPQGPGGQPMAIPNPSACGNAWFVDNIQWEKNADDEIMALSAEILGDTATPPNAFRPLQTAVLRTNYQNELNGYNIGKDSGAYVRLDKYGLNDISFVSKNSKDGFAVFSDIYYPYGWHAYIDGKETPIYKTDYLLRGLKIPAGDHKIEFKFHPQKFYTGDKIAMVASILLILLTAGGIFMAVRGKDKKPA